MTTENPYVAPKRRKRRAKGRSVEVDVGERRGEVAWIAFVVGLAFAWVRIALGLTGVGDVVPYSLLVALITLCFAVGAVAYLAWVHRIVTVDRTTHGPPPGQVNSPIGAVVTHFAPFIQWWVPYTIVRDIGRRAVGPKGKEPPTLLWWLALWAPVPIWKGLFGRVDAEILLALVGGSLTVAAFSLRRVVAVIARGQTNVLGRKAP